MRGSKSEGNLSVKLCKRTGNCKGGGGALTVGKWKMGGGDGFTLQNRTG